MLQSLFQKHRQPSSRRPESSRDARLRVESLEDRTTPNAANPFQTLAAGITHEVADIQADVKTITNVLNHNSNSTVSSAVSTLNSDLTTFLHDLSGGLNVSNDISNLLSAESSLVSALGNNINHGLRHQLNDLNHDLMDVRSDISLSPETSARMCPISRRMPWHSPMLCLPSTSAAR